MTIKELAQLAGVSPSTVSKVINGKDQTINQETRLRILKLVSEYHYTPYEEHRSRGAEKTFLLGLLVTDVRKSASLISGVLKEAAQAGYGVLLKEAGDGLRGLHALYSCRVDGILAEADGISQEGVRSLEASGIPFLLMGRETELSLDLKAYGYACADQLIAKGHRRISCLVSEHPRSVPVLLGFKQCLFDQGIPFDEGMALTLEELNRSPGLLAGYTGLAAPLYSQAAEVYSLAVKQQLQLPGELSLIALMDQEEEASLAPQVSGYVLPWKGLGQAACRSLLHRLQKTEPAGEKHFPPSPSAVFRPGCTLGPSPELPRTRVVVVGSIHMDYDFGVTGLPAAGRVTRIRQVQVKPGGKGVNQAAGAARLGCGVSLIGCLGRDEDGGRILDFLEQEQVLFKGRLAEPLLPTGKAYIYVQKDGESTITLLPGANEALTAEDIRRKEDIFKKARFCLLSSEIPEETLLEAAKTARAAGSTILFKPAALSSLPSGLGELIHYFIPNEQEAALLSPAADPASQAAYFRSLGFPVVIITLGKQGCFVHSSQWQGFLPAVQTETADSTGGADAFICALAWALGEEHPLTEAVSIAQYSASLCVSRQGGAQGMPYKEELTAAFPLENS